MGLEGVRGVVGGENIEIYCIAARNSQIIKESYIEITKNI